jgi:hypothetical protein
LQEFNSGIRALWSQQTNLEKLFSFGDYVLWFPKGNKSHLKKFTRKWFGPHRVQYVLPNNIVLFVTIEKFETNLLLVNMNKLKPYKYMEFEVPKKKHSFYFQFVDEQIIATMRDLGCRDLKKICQVYRQKQ